MTQGKYTKPLVSSYNKTIEMY